MWEKKVSVIILKNIGGWIVNIYLIQTVDWEKKLSNDSVIFMHMLYNFR